MKFLRLIFISLLLVTYSCSDDNNLMPEEESIEKEEESIEKDLNIVTLEKARSIANGILGTTKNVYSKSGKKNEIESITPIGSDE